MRLEQLYYLTELAKYPSINVASASLNLTQQSLSNSIKSLEDELNCKILIRSHKGVSFTLEGKKVLETAKNILKEWHQLQQEVTNVHLDNPIEPFRIISSHRVISNFLVKYFNQFVKLYPENPLYCESESNHTVINQFDHYIDYDLVCVTCIEKNYKLFTEIPKHLNFYPLKTLKFYLVVNRCSNYAKSKTIDISNLQDQQIKMYSNLEEFSTPEQELDFKKYLNLMGLHDNLTTSNSITFCMQGVLDNDFALLITEGSQMDLFSHPKTVAIPVTTNYQFQFGYLLPNGIDLNQTAKKFIELINTPLENTV